ncbi:FAD binding domain-containing protein [Umbelopsis sp. PMI_123]|nr:FAD binding domain-containing protein [Umbelopsis sp. PMI_123]
MLDVLICGAGPIGCFFANLMEQYGHSYRLIDDTTFESRCGQSRALLLSARSLEMMEDRGLAEEILTHCLLIRGARIFSGAKQVAQVEMRNLQTSYPHLATIPQWRLEKILLDRLSKKAERPTKLVSYSQESDHIIAKLQHGEDENDVEEVLARFIIGSDGVHSTVRKGTPGWTFDGKVFDGRFALADVTLVGEKLPDLRFVHFMGSGHGIFGIIPMLAPDDEKVICRLVVSLGKLTESDDKNENITYGINKNLPLTLEELQSHIDKRSGPFNMKAVDPIWLTTFGVNERKANGFRRGRAFIMGDAAHCHSPAGGQGMNIGLQDAYNLAWKISSVLKNVVKDPEQLLDSYFSEREPHVDQIIERSGAALRTASGNGFITEFVLSVFVPLATSIPFVYDSIGYMVQQLNVVIPPNSALLAKKSSSGIIEPGKYIPESAILIPKDIINVPQQTLRRILRYPTRHIALLVWNRAGDSNSSKAFWESLEPYKKFVRPIIVESPNYIGMYRIPAYAANNDGASTGFWCDPSSQLGELLGIPYGHAGIVFIRPDMFVAFSELYNAKSELPLTPLKDFISRYLKAE